MKTKKVKMSEIIFVVILLIATLFIRVHVFEIVKVDGSSMTPTYNDGDRVLVYKLISKSNFSCNDIVVLSKPTTSSEIYTKNLFTKLFTQRLIKRIVATEGDTINCLNGSLYINGREIENAIVSKNSYLAQMDSLLPCVVEPNDIFVLGDNRKNSSDSRDFGFISNTEIRGKAIVKLWPFS